MSGGSYNYFYSRMADLFADLSGPLADMADKLRRHAKQKDSIIAGTFDGWDDVNKKRIEKTPEWEKLEEIAAHFDEHVKEIEALAEKLEVWKEVLHSIEWTHSGDTGYADVIKEYNEIKNGIDTLKPIPDGA